MVKEMDKHELQNYIANRASKELTDGMLVNLGIGLPTKVANFVDKSIHIILQSENGFTGLDGEHQTEGYVNAGGAPVSIEKGGATFGSETSFGMIRGGHVDLTILGALQVDKYGNIASHVIPGKMVPGMGGAMDLLTGAKKVIVAMQHTNKGVHKILDECTLPLTGQRCVDLIITELGVIEVREDGLYVIELGEDVTFEEIQEATGTKLVKAYEGV